MRRPCRADLKTSSSPVRTEAGHRTALRGRISALRGREAVEGEHLVLGHGARPQPSGERRQPPEEVTCTM